MAASKTAHKVARAQVTAFVGVGMRDPFCILVFILSSERRRKRSRAGYHVRCMQPMAGLPRFADSAIPRANAEKLHDSTAITQDQTRSEQRSMGSTRMERLVFRSAAAEAGAEALPLWEEIWPGPAVKLVCPHAARLAGGRLGVRVIFALEM